MMRFRVALLATSLAVVMLFAGLLTAGLRSSESLFQALGNLAEVVHLVQSEYVDELDPDVLAHSLDAGILESVDPWAAAIADHQLEAYSEIFSAPPPYGLGLSLRLGSAAVRYVFPGSPADAAGLESWEVVEKIDGVFTRGQPLWQIALDLAERESRGETVVLIVLDRQVDERRDVALVPTEWTPVNATGEVRGEARVLQIEALTQGSSETVGSMLEDGLPMILDLRGLVWGREDEAIAVADLFVAEGTLAAWEGREAGQARFEATAPASAPTGLPVVLIGRDTEGVGEILAAALQRSGAVLVGQQTMGHAPHMQMVREGGLNLWIPVGRWLGPDDQAIDGDGISPDEEVEPTADDEEGDAVLDHALEMIRGRLAEAA
jgi:carboxyl-terminal processing protease